MTDDAPSYFDALLLLGPTASGKSALALRLAAQVPLEIVSIDSAQVYRGMLDTSASEHAARMSAMNNATRACDDMTNALTLLYNKTRQASITRDLMDIVGGAEALKG